MSHESTITWIYQVMVDSAIIYARSSPGVDPGFGVFYKFVEVYEVISQCSV